jgi:hypothetical protein
MGEIMRTLLQRTHLAVALGLGASALACGVYAEDLGKVKVTHDPAITARTNMQRPADDSSELKVSYDQALTDRTNMDRQPGEAGAVTTAPDYALRARTNMGGIAKQNSEPPVTAAAPK